MAGVRKGRGRELGRETARQGGAHHAPKFPLPLPLLTPNTQTIHVGVAHTHMACVREYLLPPGVNVAGLKGNVYQIVYSDLF